jgi:hypothetical protein
MRPFTKGCKIHKRFWSTFILKFLFISRNTIFHHRLKGSNISPICF